MGQYTDEAFRAKVAAEIDAQEMERWRKNYYDRKTVRAIQNAGRSDERSTSYQPLISSTDSSEAQNAKIFIKLLVGAAIIGVGILVVRGVFNI